LKNKVNLIGRVGKEPKKIDTKAGFSYATFSLATTSYYKNKLNTTWHTIVCFGKTAELILKHVQKGALIDVEGRIEYTKVDDKATGFTKFYTKIVADKILFLQRGGVASAQSEPYHEEYQGPEVEEAQGTPDIGSEDEVW
jgi:single-strand DNA-binding protein